MTDRFIIRASSWRGRGFRAAAVLSMAFLTLAAPAAWSQSIPGEAVVSKGLRADRSYFSPLPFEHFDPSNGNVVLTFTDLELPGNAGRSLRFTRTYNSQSAPGGETPGYQHGYWTFGISGLIIKVIDKDAPTQEWLPTPAVLNNAGLYMHSTPILVGSDGGARATFFRANPVFNSPSTQFDVISTDGFITYHRPNGLMLYPDGIAAVYDTLCWVPAPPNVKHLCQYWDQYGNTVTLTR